MKKLLSFFLLTIFTGSGFAQEIRVYHGVDKESTILRKGEGATTLSWTDDHTFSGARGKTVELVVLNPNTFFYDYELKVDEFEIKEDFPDITDLLALLNAIPGITQSSSGARGFMTKPATGSSSYAEYVEVLEDLESDIKEAKEAIKKSDKPESALQAVNLSEEAGFRGAKKIIHALPSSVGRFNSEKLLDELNDYLKRALQDPTLFIGLSSTDAEKAKDLHEKAYLLLNNQLVQTINQVKKAIEVPGILTYSIQITDKNLKVRLIVKKKGAQGARMQFDKLLCTIIPLYERKAVELVPVVNLTFASGVSEFGLDNGVVVEKQGDGLKFRVGAMLLYNFAHFGKYKTGSWGAGIGYSIPQKNVLESFHIGTLVSYKQIFRFGFGTGFSAYPSGLKNNTQVGEALPADIKNIEEIVEYQRKQSFFITFSISGLTLLKK